MFHSWLGRSYALGNPLSGNILDKYFDCLMTLVQIYIVVIVIFPRGRGVLHEGNTSGHVCRHYNTEQRQRDIGVIGVSWSLTLYIIICYKER